VHESQNLQRLVTYEAEVEVQGNRYRRLEQPEPSTGFGTTAHNKSKKKNTGVAPDCCD
jgi:hypothetical protein